MPSFLVETLYQTPSGNANGHRCTVSAKDGEEAFTKAQEICRRERRVGKIDGGDILATYPDTVTISGELLARIVNSLGAAESFMSGFVGDDTQDEPVDDDVEEISAVIAELDKIEKAAVAAIP